MSSESKGDTSHRKKEFRCSLCRVTCFTDLSFLAHNRGARHSKALRSYRGRDYDQKPLKKLTSLKDFINDPERNEPLIGLQYVEEGRKIKSKRHYRCTLCEHDMAMQVMFDHLIGHKHRRSYLNKHFPLLIKGVQTPTVAVLKALAKEVEEEEGLQTYATNVPIKLQPRAAKKHSENSSEQFSSQSDTLEPMLTDADDVLDNIENVLAMTGSLLPPWEPVPLYEENLENSSNYKKHDGRSKSSSRDSDYSSKRHRDSSPSRHKRSENSSKRRSSHERERSSKRYKDHSPTQYKKRSSSREADYASKKNRDRSPHRYQNRSSSHEADYVSKRDRNRSPRCYQKRSTSRETDHASRRDRDHSPPQYQERSTSRETDHVSRRDRDHSPPQYQNPESSGKSSRDGDYKRQRDSSPPHKSTTQHRSSDRKERTVEYLPQPVSHSKYIEESNSEKTYDSASHSSSGNSKDNDDSAKKREPERRQSSSGYSKNDKPAKTCDSGSHSSSEYSKDAERQGNSAVQSSQNTTSAAAGGLSPDILKILQGKDVPTVTSILNRLAQYYPPLQNVDISLLVSVLFESGALK